MNKKKFKNTLVILDCPAVCSFISTNKIYSGMHYRQRMAIKDEYQWFIISQTRKAQKEGFFLPLSDPSNYPARLYFNFYFKKNSFDASNCTFMAKLIEDALVLQKIIPGDSPKYIQSISCQSIKEKIDRIKVTIRY